MNENMSDNKYNPENFSDGQYLTDDATYLSDHQAMRFYAHTGLNLFFWGYEPIDRKLKTDAKKYKDISLPLVGKDAAFYGFEYYWKRKEQYTFLRHKGKLDKGKPDKNYQCDPVTELKDLKNKVWGLFPCPMTNIIAIDDDGNEDGAILREAVPIDYPFYFPSIGKRNSKGDLIKCGTYLFNANNLPDIITGTKNMISINLDIRFGGKKATKDQYSGAIFMPGFGCSFKAFNKHAVKDFIV